MRAMLSKALQGTSAGVSARDCDMKVNKIMMIQYFNYYLILKCVHHAYGPEKTFMGAI